MLKVRSRTRPAPGLPPLLPCLLSGVVRSAAAAASRPSFLSSSLTLASFFSASTCAFLRASSSFFAFASAASSSFCNGGARINSCVILLESDLLLGVGLEAADRLAALLQVLDRYLQTY